MIRYVIDGLTLIGGGGGIVALVTLWLSRRKRHAEADTQEAVTAKTTAETAEITDRIEGNALDRLWQIVEHGEAERKRQADELVTLREQVADLIHAREQAEAALRLAERERDRYLTERNQARDELAELRRRVRRLEQRADPPVGPSVHDTPTDGA